MTTIETMKHVLGFLEDEYPNAPMTVKFRTAIEQMEKQEPVACMVPCASVSATVKVDGQYYQIAWGTHHLATRWLYEHPSCPVEAEQQANAVLIAHAPDLLRSLIDCEARLALLVNSGRSKMLDAVAGEHARAVIAAALGR